MNTATKKFWELYSSKMQSNSELFKFLFNNSMVQLGNYQNFLEWYPNVIKQLNNGRKFGEFFHSTWAIGKKFINDFKASSDFNDENLYWFLYDKLTGVVNIHPLDDNDLPLVNKMMGYCLADGNSIDHLELLLNNYKPTELVIKTGIPIKILNSLYQNRRPNLKAINDLKAKFLIKLDNYYLKSNLSKEFKLGSFVNPNDTKTLAIYCKLSVSKYLPKSILCDLAR